MQGDGIILNDAFRDLVASTNMANFGAQEVSFGIAEPKQLKITKLSANEWEEFVEEWAMSLQPKYVKVRRYGGGGDMGIDVAGFNDDRCTEGVWDNYQCKMYGSSLTPSRIWVEIGKIIYWSFQKEYKAPRRYYFVAPHGLAPSLRKIIKSPGKILSGLRENWNKYCRTGITDIEDIKLDGEFSKYLDEFDYSIFDDISAAELIVGHNTTPFHSVRFGGGLPPKAPAAPMPPEMQKGETVYIQHLLDAYADSLGRQSFGLDNLKGHNHLAQHFSRSRVLFYEAEWLERYARDNVPPGTFEKLQREVYHGIADVYEGSHPHGLACVRATVTQAGNLPLTSNALVSRLETQEKQGICHQLSNNGILIWVEKNRD